MLSNVCEYFPGTYVPHMFICSPGRATLLTFCKSVKPVWGVFFGLVMFRTWELVGVFFNSKSD